ncbi:MAG TPA: hypothetical protein PLT51_00240 [Candidatus Dojkabacteria bacterium]|jgi:hypothetical protein|nr:hypothetical protein [Candidatus Dojkabacteria bacterium]
MAKKLSKPVAIKPDRQWEIDDAVRTLQRAEAIKKDKFLMGGVKRAVADLNKMAFGGQPKAPAKKKK